jgi:D-amino peptidase
MPDRFAVEVAYKEHAMAYRKSFYPGARSTGPHTVQFEADDYFEVLRFFSFCLG